MVSSDSSSHLAASRSRGGAVVAALREIDQIAYIRFASVYQSFEDLETLKREVDELLTEKSAGKGKRRIRSVEAEV